MHPFTIHAAAEERRADLLRDAEAAARARAVRTPGRVRAAIGRPLLKLGALLIGEQERRVRLDEPARARAPRHFRIDENTAGTC